MPRIRRDNDSRYILKSDVVDADGKPLEPPYVLGDKLLDGGFANSVYLPDEEVDGGDADG